MAFNGTRRIANHPPMVVGILAPSVALTRATTGTSRRDTISSWRAPCVRGINPSRTSEDAGIGDAGISRDEFVPFPGDGGGDRGDGASGADWPEATAGNENKRREGRPRLATGAGAEKAEQNRRIARTLISLMRQR